MSKSKTESELYDFLNSPISEEQDLSINKAIEYFALRFDTELFKNNCLDNKKFYIVSVLNTENLFNIVKPAEKKLLAISLINFLYNNYCKKELLPSMRWFFAGVIYRCFWHLREDDKSFKEAFCTFDANEGECSKFCRLIVVAAIEYYCRVKRSDVEEFYKKVIRFDSEMITYCKDTKDELVLKEIWLEWCKSSLTLGIDTYNALWGKDFIKSVYWPIKNPKSKIIISM